MWNFNLATLAQVSSFVGFTPVQTVDCSKKGAMNVQAAPGVCSQSSAWHRRLKAVKEKATVSRRGSHRASHVPQAGRRSSSGRSSRHSSSEQVTGGSGGVPSIVANSSVPWSQPDVKPLVSGTAGPAEAKSKTPSAMSSVWEAGVEYGAGFDDENADFWKNGRSLRRRLDHSAWKLPRK